MIGGCWTGPIRGSEVDSCVGPNSPCLPFAGAASRDGAASRAGAVSCAAAQAPNTINHIPMVEYSTLLAINLQNAPHERAPFYAYSTIFFFLMIRRPPR